MEKDDGRRGGNGLKECGGHEWLGWRQRGNRSMEDGDAWLRLSQVWPQGEDIAMGGDTDEGCGSVRGDEERKEKKENKTEYENEVGMAAERSE